MMALPFIFIPFIIGFPAGLVLYWITNNTITFAQQYMIMRSHGYKPDILGNMFGGRNKDKAKPKTSAGGK